MTNFNKLVRWDADFYKDTPEDDCIVCLTEREVYLIGNIIDALKWSGTRWVGNIVGLDFDKIASDLKYKLDERMTCQNLGDLLQKLTQLEKKIDIIYGDTIIDNGDTLPTPDTAPYDVTTPEAFNEEFSIATEGCDTDDKDALYAGIREFVLYVNQANIDALQNIGQAGNLAAQAGRLISGVPVLGLLPFDEIADYTAFLMNELLDEYEATVNDELLENVTCDLFCIAVNSDCTFNLADAINYYGGKLGSTVFDLYDNLANVVQFAATGTFSGDDYFYFMTVFQFIAVAVADSYFAVNGMDYYMVQVATGMNSPDNDWTLLCDACPPMYRLYTHEFSGGLGIWEATGGLGSIVGGRLKGADLVGNRRIEVFWNDFDTTWRIRGVKVYGERIGGISDNADDRDLFMARVTANSNTGATFYIDVGGVGNNVFERCGKISVSPFYKSNFTQLFLFAKVSDPANLSDIYIDKVEILFELNFAPDGTVITQDGDLCS